MAEARRAAYHPHQLAGARFLIIEARFYDGIGALLLQGAEAALREAGASWDTVNVPGALEIPVAASMAAAADKGLAGIVALGCIIRGETYHFEIVANESARGLMDVGIRHGLPVGNGILSVENEAQALVRADPQLGNKGADAARAAMSLYALQQSRAG
ncbi:MAG: 6,7-dimethyl-8-ribityllumazine synthase [Hyphomicrobiales bacterium]|nr:6,7-dimethyl-8-ribityllumazine synthase [Hyphomicrobiales bacterium]